MYSDNPINDFDSYIKQNEIEEAERQASLQAARADFMSAAKHGDATADNLRQFRRDHKQPLGHGNYALRPELLWETVRDVIELEDKLAVRLVQLLLGSANNGDKVAAELVADIANAYAENQQ